MVTYFDFQEKLIYLFFVLSCIAFVIMGIYGEWFISRGEKLEDYDFNTWYHHLSFGNMGFSKSLCIKTVISEEIELFVNCETSTKIK